MYIFGSNTVKIKIPGVRFSGVLREENEMKRKILAAVFWTMAAASAFAGAEPVPAAEKSEEAIWQKPDMEGIDTENTKIGISIYQFDDTFMTLYRTELVRYLTEELGFDEKNIIVEDGKNDQEKQTDQIERFIADQADVMILNLVHASAAPMITDLCSEAGIPVVYINRQPDFMEMERWDLEGIQAAYIGADARQSGIFQGEEIAETENKGDVNGDGEVSYIMIQGEPENIDTQYRTAYSVKALENAGVEARELLAQRGDWNQSQGQKIMEEALDEFGDEIEVVFCNNDAMALGALEAIREADRTVGEDIYLAGVDALEEAVQSVVDGEFTGTVFNDYFSQSHGAAELAVKFLKGEETDPVTLVDYVKVTQDNAEEILELVNSKK